MLMKLTVVITSQYRHISNHVVHLKLVQCYASHISIKLKKKKDVGIDSINI